jgi:putative DNA primase/helicase
MSAHLEVYSILQLADMVARHAVRFQTWVKAIQDWTDIDPPSEIIAAYHGAHQYGSPGIAGVATSPQLRRNLTVQSEPGYDYANKTWYKPSDNLKLSRIPEHPTRDDAVAALGRLKKRYGEFAFDGEVSRSAALAYLMTTVAVTAINGPVPLFVITAPNARTGKSYLTKLIGVIVTGHIPVFSAGSKDEVELDKRIETVALAGRSMIVFNNMPRGTVIKSERVSEFVTERVVSIRKLGRHEEGECDVSATTLSFNGNNITVAADLVPRSIICRLDANMARPETRTFNNNPLKAAFKERGQDLADIFTIIRAFREAGEPAQDVRRMADFEQWSRIIQQPLVWLGMEDPAKSQDIAYEEDEERKNARSLLALWKEHLGMAESFKTKEILDKVNVYELVDAVTGQAVHPSAVSAFGPPPERRYQWQELYDLLMTKCGVRGAIDPTRFGNWLRDLKGESFDLEDGDYRVVAPTESEKHGHRWKLQKAG